MPKALNIHIFDLILGFIPPRMMNCFLVSSTNARFEHQVHQTYCFFDQEKVDELHILKSTIPSRAYVRIVWHPRETHNLQQDD